MGRVVWILLVCGNGWLLPRAALAQQAAPLQEFDKFFDQLLPPLTEQERERLASIPVSSEEERQLTLTTMQKLLLEGIARLEALEAYFDRLG